MDTWNLKKTKLGYCIFAFLVIYHIFSYVLVDGRSISSRKTIELAKLKGIIKTIQVEDGDIIDCVDIYKQPAFDHPLLKNHTIQMKPNSYPMGVKENNTLKAELLQNWHKYGECPERTIPILRSQQNKFLPKKTFVSHRNKLETVVSPHHEYAQVSVLGGNYFGASGQFNVWRPTTFNNEFSLAQIWVIAGHGDGMNTVEAGWKANSEPHQTRLFIFWTSDGYQQTGCYNLECPGFVQTSKKIYLGSRLVPLSTYGGKQSEMSIFIHKDKQSGNWWLRILEIDIGYWPSWIFNKLSDRAEVISWGGEIINLGLQGRHTSTKMGSGHFPSEGPKKASYIRNLRYMDESGAIKDAKNVVPYVTKPACYDLQMGRENNWGTHIFYGGPGYSNKCPL